MSYATLLKWMPGWLRRHVLHFDYVADDAVAAFARRLPAGARVLDAGAGQSRHRAAFGAQRYVALDLAIGDADWDYGGLDVLGDLTRLPFRDGACEAALNIVTLEHVREPLAVVCELARVLQPGGALLMVVPHEWEEHQTPHDYFRFTRYGLTYLLETAGFRIVRLEPVGGFFRLLARRLLNALQFFPWWLLPLAALVFVPLGLLMPLLDGLDTRRNFTLGFVCEAVRR